MKSEHQIKQLAKQIRFEPDGIVDERVLACAEAVLEKSTKIQTSVLHRRHLIWRTIMRNSMTKLATAAGIIIAAFIFIHQLGGSVDGTTAALARAIENTKKMPWMHVISQSSYNGGQKRTEHGWYHFASKKHFSLASNGAAWCWDNSEAQKQYTYNPHDETLIISDLPKGGFHGSDSAFSMLESLLTNWNKKVATIKQHTERLDGRKVEVYEIVETLPDEAMSIGSAIVAKIQYKLLADTETSLILAGRMERLDKNNKVLARTEQQIDYPKIGPNDIYALGVPRTAEIIDMTGTTLARQTDDPRLVALDIQLPKAMFVGTPQDTRTPHLERPLGKPRPPFLAPVGTKNVALGKPVSSSDEEPIIGQLDMITDGDKEAADGSYVELGPLVQYVTIDLEAMYEIYAIVIWHYHKQARVYYDVVVQMADDADFITNVKTVFNNDRDNSAGLGVGKDLHYTETNEGKLIDVLSQGSVKARYIRFYSNTNTSNDLNHYIEVEVYGKPVK
jgi:hypothetical protein